MITCSRSQVTILVFSLVTFRQLGIRSRTGSSIIPDSARIVSFFAAISFLFVCFVGLVDIYHYKPNYWSMIIIIVVHAAQLPTSPGSRTRGYAP